MINSRSTAGATMPARTAPLQAAARAVADPGIAAANDEMNPLWIIAAGMAIFFAVAAALVAAS